MPVLDRFRIDDRVAVVTGASSGLGVAFAQALAEAGASVIGIGEYPEHSLDDQLKGWMTHYHRIPNVTDVGALTDAVRWIAARASTIVRLLIRRMNDVAEVNGMLKTSLGEGPFCPARLW